MDDQSNLNKSEFEGMDDAQRVLYEGFRPGMYVRLEIQVMSLSPIFFLSLSFCFTIFISLSNSTKEFNQQGFVGFFHSKLYLFFKSEPKKYGLDTEQIWK